MATLPTPFPADFRSLQVANADATINVRVGGHGPAVVLIHGFGDTGDMWSPMAAELAKDHTVVVPDLRGMGLSSHAAGGYDKWTQAGDIRAVLDTLGIDRADIVGHDIGAMVAYAYAARYPDKTSRLVVMDSPLPGIPPWNQIVRLPALWHFDVLRSAVGYLGPESRASFRGLTASPSPPKCAHQVQILELLDAAVLSVGFDNSIGGRQVDGSLRQSIRCIGATVVAYGTVPTIVPETRQNSVCRANASQLARSGK